MIIRLKAIESREDIFCYLSSYLHRSFLFHLVIVTSNHCIMQPSSRCGDLGVDRLQAIESSRPRVVAEARSIEASSRHRSCCAFGSSSSGRATLVIEYSRSVSTPTLTSSEFLVDKPRWRIRSTITKATINFSHSRRADHLSGCIRSNAPQLHHPETTRSSCHWVLR